MKVIDRLLNHLKDKKDYLLNLEIFIDIPVVCIKCKNHGHHIKECGKKEKVKKEKTERKQERIDIKLVTIQYLMTKVKMIKQEIKEIKEDNSTDINEQNIKEIVNLKDFSKLLTDFLVTDRSMIDPPEPPIEKDVTNINSRHNFYFSKNYTLIDSRADMNCIQEGLIPLKYYEKPSERLTQANGEKLIINYKIPNVHICNDEICFETFFVLIKNLYSKVILGNPFMALLYPFLTTNEGIKTNVSRKVMLKKN